MYISYYQSPLGQIDMTGDGEFLTGLWFDSSTDAQKHNCKFEEKELPIFNEVSKWLDI